MRFDIEKKDGLFQIANQWIVIDYSDFDGQSFVFNQNPKGKYSIKQEEGSSGNDPATSGNDPGTEGKDYYENAYVAPK